MSRPAHICLVIEIKEHGKHEDVLREPNECYENWELAGIAQYDEQKVQCQIAELQQLHCGYITLPPEQLLAGTL